MILKGLCFSCQYGELEIDLTVIISPIMVVVWERAEGLSKEVKPSILKAGKGPTTY